jgi:hypothetical protein
MFLLNLLAKPVYAQCPVCVVTVGGGLFIAKKLGIDDLLVSIWLSGLNTAIAFWMASAIKKKILNNGYLWTFGFFIASIITFVLTKQIGHLGNVYLGIDKVVFGLTVGLVISLLAILIDRLTRKMNNGKVYFPYQKVVVPLVLLTITTFIFKALLKV